MDDECKTTKEIVEEFILEASEHLEDIEKRIVSLEKDQGGEKEREDHINSIFRSFHTIKGNSKWLSFNKIEVIAHAAESLLSDLRSKKLVISPSIIDAILKTVDCIEVAIDKLKKRSLESFDETAILKILEVEKNLPKISKKVAVDNKIPDIKTDAGLQTESNTVKNNLNKNINIKHFEDIDLLLGDTSRINVSFNNLWNFLKTLIITLESHEDKNIEKSFKVIKNSLMMARGLVPEDKKKDIIVAGLVYDIGMFGIPPHILNKRGKLTEDEITIIKGHPNIIADAIQNITALQYTSLIIRHHHERFDGKGYPGHLKGEDIPIESRILAIADTFNAMVSFRPYRNKLSLLVVHSEINQCSGTQFDPKIVEIFNRLFDEGKLV